VRVRVRVRVRVCVCVCVCVCVRARARARARSVCRGGCALRGLVVVLLLELFTVWTCGIYRLKFSVVRQS